jgi:quinolinate synthase
MAQSALAVQEFTTLDDATCDDRGPTEFIIKTIKVAEPNTRWLVGTELNLVWLCSACWMCRCK